MKKKLREYPWTDKAAGKIAKFGLKVQQKFAKVMNKLTVNFSKGRLKFWLVVFCIVWGGLSVYFIGAAMLRSDAAQRSFTVEPIHPPLHVAPPPDEMNQPLVDDQTYQQIQSFKLSPLYDSTIKLRPGLADSILLLEQIYQSQQK